VGNLYSLGISLKVTKLDHVVDRERRFYIICMTHFVDQCFETVGLLY